MNLDHRMENVGRLIQTWSIRRRAVEIISFGKNAGNHNGGTIAFGPDGYLYLATGDGGNANDVGASHVEPGGNAQNLTYCRWARCSASTRSIPTLTTGSPIRPAATASIASRPRIRSPAPARCREIYAYGFRNPYRFAFDHCQRRSDLADVGQNNIEEIDR